MDQALLTALWLELNTQLPWFMPVVLACLGGAMGSFLGCMAYRLPRKVPLRQPPSACPVCHKRLTVVDLVPVFSWLWLRGRCRHCGALIGWRSVMAETLLAVGSGGLFLWIGPVWATLGAVLILWTGTFVVLLWAEVRAYRAEPPVESFFDHM